MLLEDMVAELKEKLQDDKVVLGLSGRFYCSSGFITPGYR
jgi:hypothetical protein